MNSTLKKAAIIGLCILSGLMAGCGDNKDAAKNNNPAQQAQAQQVKYGFISGNDVILREGPSTSTKNTGFMNKGLKVEVLDTVKTSDTDTWHKIKLSDGKTGYVFGKFLKNTEAEAMAQKSEDQNASGIPIPSGYKLHKSGPNYIVIESAKKDHITASPAIIYNGEDVSFCAKVITDCMGPRSIIGGRDGELVTIYKDGRVSVVTAIGATDLYRYYNTKGELVVFKKGNDNGGWTGRTKADPCRACGKMHHQQGKLFVYSFTARDGVKSALSYLWK